MKFYMFRTVRLSIIRSLFTVHSAMVHVTQVCRLSETCSLSWQNKFVKLVHLVDFITKKVVTMHGHMHLKFVIFLMRRIHVFQRVVLLRFRAVQQTFSVISPTCRSCTVIYNNIHLVPSVSVCVNWFCSQWRIIRELPLSFIVLRRSSGKSQPNYLPLLNASGLYMQCGVQIVRLVCVVGLWLWLLCRAFM
jgi:hypothetical protein